MHRNFHIIRDFEMVKNSPGNDNGAARESTVGDRERRAVNARARMG